MPFAGTVARASPLPLYFDTLTAFDTWRATLSGPLDHSEGVLKYIPRQLRTEDVSGKGKLLVFLHHCYRDVELNAFPGLS